MCCYKWCPNAAGRWHPLQATQLLRLQMRQLKRRLHLRGKPLPDLLELRSHGGLGKRYGEMDDLWKSMDVGYRYDIYIYIHIHNTTWHDITLHDITWHDITLHDVTWHDMTLHYRTLHYMTVQYNTIQYNTIHTCIHINIWMDMIWIWYGYFSRCSWWKKILWVSH